MDGNEVQSRTGRTKANSIWLKVDDEEEMIDLLDKNTVIQHVVTTNPFISRKISRYFSIFRSFCKGNFISVIHLLR